MTALTIDVARVFHPLLGPARYKGAHGGRGSGKSQFFAGLIVDLAIRKPGLRAICCREVQKSLKESAKRLIEQKIEEYEVGHLFGVQEAQIRTPGDGVIVFAGLQDHTAESIKSYEGFDIAWVEEAQTVSPKSLNLLRPTIRKPGSELWFSWNPRFEFDPVDKMLRGAELPTGAVVVRANWDANPWFPAELEQERRDCLRMQPEQYDHIWEGGYVTVSEGAYYARHLAEAKTEGRIGEVDPDPLMEYRCFWDIGTRDATAIWVAQFVGSQVRVLNYYEAVGQPLASHLEWLRTNGYASALCYLPHDGANPDHLTAERFEDHIRAAGFRTEVVKNQGKQAAMKRVEAARRLFPSIRFNEKTTEAGRAALGWYHEKRDEQRNYGLGPDHDWSSHGCFTADTLVLTRYGTCRISNLPETGEILTPCGWKQYIWPRVTRIAAPLVEVAFVGGHTVRCTPDHLFLTEGGWKSAESLVRGSAIQSSLTRSRSILTVASTAFGRARHTTLGEARSFTAMFGRMLSGLFPRAAISIIGTAIPPITSCQTWNAWMGASTCPTHGIQPRTGGRLASATLRATLRLTGTDQRLVASGTRGTQSGPSRGQNGSASRGPASTARKSFSASLEPTVTSKSIAAQIARSLRIALAANRTNGPLIIERVRPLNETADVWDITVPDGHCFSLANGAVVHNSDAFGLMAIAHEEPRKAQKLDYSILKRRVV